MITPLKIYATVKDPLSNLSRTVFPASPPTGLPVPLTDGLALSRRVRLGQRARLGFWRSHLKRFHSSGLRGSVTSGFSLLCLSSVCSFSCYTYRIAPILPVSTPRLINITYKSYMFYLCAVCLHKVCVCGYNRYSVQTQKAMTKTISARIEPNLHEQITSKARQLGLSINTYLKRVLTNSVCVADEQLDLSSIDIAKGTLAESMLLTGEVVTKETHLSKTTRLVVAEGYLWLVRPTANWSRRELHKVCSAPSVISAGRMLQKWLDMSLKSIREVADLMTQVIALPWFDGLPKRQQEHVIERVINGDECSIVELNRDYAEPVEPKQVLTESVCVADVETVKPKVAKAGQLMARYDLTNIWHNMVNSWKQNGLTTIDGVWTYARNSNQWVLNCG